MDNVSVEVGQDAGLPVIQVAPPEVLNCLDTTVVINANGSSNTPELDIFWSTEDGNILTGQNSLFPTVDAPGAYQLTISNPTTGCITTRDIQVSQNILPPQLTLGDDVQLSCVTQTAHLNASIQTQGAFTINWTTTNGNIVFGDTGVNPFVDTPGIYQAEVVDLTNFCSVVNEVAVFINDIESVEFFAIDPACTFPFGQIEFGGIVGGTPPYSYSIDGGSSFQSPSFFTNLDPGAYELVVQDSQGCEATAEATVDFAPELRLVLEPLIELQLGDSHRINPQLSFPDSAITQIFWTPTEGLSCIDCLRPIVSPNSSRVYQLTVISRDGCVADGSIRFQVDRQVPLFFPNAFSPNGDGNNDVYFPFGSNNAVSEVEVLQIFNRWGEMVFENLNFQPNTPGQGWDGRHRGELLNPAVFVFQATVRLIDGTVRQVSGDLTLVR